MTNSEPHCIIEVDVGQDRTVANNLLKQIKEMGYWKTQIIIRYYKYEYEGLDIK